MNFWLNDTKFIKNIATLGPEGSSSEIAAHYMSELLSKKLEVHLFKSFELASNYVERKNDCILLIPNAYHKANYFYMNPKTKFIGSFFFSPPDYYICCKSIIQLRKKIKLNKLISIISHKAVQSRIPYLVESVKDNCNLNISIEYTKIYFSQSTSHSAREVKIGNYDCCIANKKSAMINQLRTISSALNIEMAWSIFAKNNYNNERNNLCHLINA